MAQVYRKADYQKNLDKHHKQTASMDHASTVCACGHGAGQHHAYARPVLYCQLTQLLPWTQLQF